MPSHHRGDTLPVEERQRVALRNQIAAAWGEEAADTLFELIAPAGHEPATKQDLERGFDHVDRRFEQIDRRFEQVEHRFQLLESRLDERFAAFGERFERRIADAVTTQTRTLVFSQLAALVVIAALAFGLR